MLASHAPVALRRLGALVTSASLLALLAIPALAGPVAAQVPTCAGKVATITDNDGNDADPAVGVIKGTSGPDVIVGTDGDDLIMGYRGSDIICGGLGDDRIFGAGGNDRLYGGNDNDKLYGGSGADKLYGGSGDDDLDGAAGKDFLKGGPGEDDLFGGADADSLQGNGFTDYLDGQGGNDRLNGGAGDDDCTQGPGSGRVSGCELADLKVTAACPADAGAGITTCQVKVKNRGPQASAYFLLPEEVTVAGATDCTPSGWMLGDRVHFPALAPGASRTRAYAMDCDGAAGSVRFSARVDTDARDPRPGNDKASRVIDFS